MQLPDVNVLIYAHREDAPEHERYAALSTPDMQAGQFKRRTRYLRWANAVFVGVIFESARTRRLALMPQEPIWSDLLTPI